MTVGAALIGSAARCGLLRLCLIFAFLMSLVLASTNAFAEIETRLDSTGRRPLMYVELRGVISSKDAAFFEKINIPRAAERRDGVSKEIVVHLNSSGGDVVSAMKIGRLLRRFEIMTIVPERGQCYSACVLVLAGAVRRIVYESAKVGIHRPYLPNMVETTPEAEKVRYQGFRREVEDYLSESSVDVSLFRDMMLIPPERLRLLSFDEMERYGINGDAPYIQEADAHAAAAKLGISRKELARRSALEFDICGDWPDFDRKEDFISRWRCRDRVLKFGR